MNWSLSECEFESESLRVSESESQCESTTEHGLILWVELLDRRNSQIMDSDVRVCHHLTCACSE